MSKSKIEWTDSTWNPVRGCKKISAGCTNCYAEVFAERWRGIPGHPYKQGFDLRFVPEKLVEPLRWTKSRMVFTNSMSDLFQDGIPDEYIDLVFDVMDRADWHVFQVLTKRAIRLRDYVSGRYTGRRAPAHIWLGVSVENQREKPRISLLQDTPARVRFLSIEPLLEYLGPLPLMGIHWAIVGGESGRKPRPMDYGWVQSIRMQCRINHVPFFFKQWGGVNKKTAGRLLDGRTFDEYPEFHFNPLPANRSALVREMEERIRTWRDEKPR